MREVDRATRPAPCPEAEKQSDIYFVREALWLGVVRPILDALAFSVSVSQITAFYFVDVFVKVYCCIRSSSNLVVSNRSPRISSTPCRRIIYPD